MTTPSRTFLPALALLAGLLLAGCSNDRGPAAPTVRGPALRIAFMSTKPPSINSGNDIYFYDVASGQPSYMPPNVNTVFDEGLMGLSADGHWMAFNSTRLLTGSFATMFMYDTRSAAVTLLQTPGTGLYFGAQNPALSGDGSRLAFHYQLGGGGLFDLSVALLDVKADTIIPTPSLHVDGAGEFDPELSGDGNLIAFTSNRLGSLDVFLYSVSGDSIVPTPGLNSDRNDTGVSISADGRYVAFHSDRPGGSGLFDIYVYDRRTSALLPLPGANTALSELNPALSPDGRYVAYTSENDGAGDIRLYDIVAQKLVKVPGLNDPYYPERFASVSAMP